MSKKQLNIYQKVGMNIKQLRIQKGLSIKQLSQKSGMSIYCLLKIEKGSSNNLTLVGALEIAKALSVEINDIFQNL